jgi:hypothetical protein
MDVCIDFAIPILLDEMWTIYPAWTMFRTLIAQPITKLLNSLT